MFIGAGLSGVAVDFFTTKTGSVVTRNWTGFWVSSAASAFVVAVFVAAFFHSRGKVQNKADSSVAEAAI
jgi:hypothetical protein